ncbi:MULTISPECIES: flagellar basal body-associated protein FliL [Pseudomonas]|jgi:flagellar FliL protein|uniref:Flagellar protein FliL n=2 Tax=Pseudomonas TaxID=286 RepID=A0A9X8HHN5_PSEPU|nr:MULTISPECIES: flagellar basal body-associated protein FliL [Pseudomonas]KTC17351.1 flagellar basal body protein FliL [Pseudomonas putida]MBG8561559.1 flagellar basal body-associated protein FliL [Pseudomonas qingdaonensis]MCO7506734.1 flagellar basal body-associated protein FliL [Pseudomonas sp. VE 267-6A]MCO7531522.1 flagellar basal body-associated protein FliL [Pseudomonas sp. 2]MCP8350091.1 flagellar basal body-associated protein FliL [Pseudomonas sp. FBF18]
MAKSEAVKDPAVKGKLKLILLLVLALLLAIGLSVGATWFFLQRGDSKPQVDPATVSNVRPAAIYEPLAPAFVVNFNQNGRQRYMQVSITMQGRDQAALDALKVHMPVIRNNLVMLFSGQPFDSLATPVGQEMLRQKATASVQEVAQKEVGKLVIDQLLFTNFVLQ